ncbi:MAG TPA: hypothetical protein VHW02_12565 [Rhizomicrobium sp.]|jgi:hypothetical protein|nr:hypothetical protein [Rhizomicrobium sp.]
MVAYRTLSQESDEQSTAYENRPRTNRSRQGLSHELFHGLSPEEFDAEARSLAQAEAMTPSVRARLRAQLTERLKTPVDAPSWGPDWVKHGERYAPTRSGEKRGVFGLFGKTDGDDADAPAPVLSAADADDAHIIARNMEKSRQVSHYRWLYVLGGVVAVVIALLAMFVDYQIIRGDIWTRALSNEFMIVPASLQASVIFKSMQVIFAVLIIHFMLKITGVYGRNTLVATAFVLALVMIGCLGYLVAYNNMVGGTSATLEHSQSVAPSDNSNAIDQLFGTSQQASAHAPVVAASMPGAKSDELAFNVPKLSDKTLANADSWFWLAFASVIFFIVSTVAALYMQSTENNIRNVLLSGDYKHRKRQFAQLHLLEMADRDQNVRTTANAS